MPDARFEYSFQPSNPAEHVARMAVHYRLTQPDQQRPRCPATKEEWEKAFNRLLVCWRKRIIELAQQGVYRFELEKIQRMRNCLPWGVGVKMSGLPVAFYCRRRDICPWCAAREVGKLYTLVRRTLREGDALLTVTHNEYFGHDVPEGPSREFLRQKLQTCRLMMQGMVRANNKVSRAASWSVTLEPPILGSRHPLDFCVRCRCLLILPVETPSLFVTALPGWNKYRVHNPDEPACQKLVAGVCAYPTGLLLGPAEATQMVLEAKSGLRLSEISGALRGQPAEIIEVAPG